MGTEDSFITHHVMYLGQIKSNVNVIYTAKIHGKRLRVHCTANFSRDDQKRSFIKYFNFFSLIQNKFFCVFTVPSFFPPYLVTF